MVCLLYAADAMKRRHVWRKVKSYSSSLVFRLSTALFFYKSRDCYHFWPSFVLSFCNQSLLISVSVVWKAAAFTHLHFLVSSSTEAYHLVLSWYVSQKPSTSVLFLCVPVCFFFESWSWLVSDFVVILCCFWFFFWVSAIFFLESCVNVLYCWETTIET